MKQQWERHNELTDSIRRALRRGDYAINHLRREDFLQRSEAILEKARTLSLRIRQRLDQLVEK